jgi:hypothetical protein
MLTFGYYKDKSKKEIAFVNKSIHNIKIIW